MIKSNKTSEEIFNFPCDYPVKIFGKKCVELEKITCEIINKHCGEIHPHNISQKESSKGGYISITIRIIATSRNQLDAMNSELQNHSLIAYVL